MRFEPERAEQDDADDGLVGSDLRALADQLKDDAAFLAARYPASAARLPATVDNVRSRFQGPRTWRRWLVDHQLAAAILLLALGAGVLFFDGNRLGGSSRMLGDAPDLPPPTRFVDQGGLSHALDNSPRDLMITPAMMFHELSGSEKEAVLDLLEEQPSAPLSLSF